jgi:hypothetical protein
MTDRQQEGKMERASISGDVLNLAKAVHDIREQTTKLIASSGAIEERERCRHLFWLLRAYGLCCSLCDGLTLARHKAQFGLR